MLLYISKSFLFKSGEDFCHHGSSQQLTNSCLRGRKFTTICKCTNYTKYTNIHISSNHHCREAWVNWHCGTSVRSLSVQVSLLWHFLSLVM